MRWSETHFQTEEYITNIIQSQYFSWGEQYEHTEFMMEICLLQQGVSSLFGDGEREAEMKHWFVGRKEWEERLSERKRVERAEGRCASCSRTPLTHMLLISRGGTVEETVGDRRSKTAQQLVCVRARLSL